MRSHIDSGVHLLYRITRCITLHLSDVPGSEQELSVQITPLNCVHVCYCQHTFVVSNLGFS